MKEFEKYSLENIQFYSENASTELLRKWLKKNKPKKIFDLGCGDGAILFDLNRNNLLKNVKCIAGIDLSPVRLRRIKNNLPMVKTIASDVYNLSKLSLGSADFIICSQLIEHVRNDQKLIQIINNNLVKGGQLYISSVIRKWYGFWIYRNKKGRIALDPTHIREYPSAKFFCSVIEKAGFKIKEVNMKLFTPRIVHALMRLLIKKKIINNKFVFQKYYKSKIFQKIIKYLRIPVFGYYIIEVIAEKNREL